MTRIYDNLMAGQGCLHANGDNDGRKPAVVRWRYDGPPGPNAWFTDSCLPQAKEVEAECKIAWILEPREYRATAYEYVEKHGHEFDFILSYDESLLRKQDSGVFPYFFGGTRVAPKDWSPGHVKHATVSIVASEKRGTVGQRMRHEVIQKTKVDAFGPEYHPIARKIGALIPYRFNVAIEACKLNWWFTEALLDCFLTGTVPIYWGCPKIGRLFDSTGIIQVNDITEIQSVIPKLTPDMYDSMRPAIETNFNLAKKYELTEDLLFQQYPNLFDEVAL